MCGQADPERANRAMEVVWDRLVDRSDRLVRLFTPALDIGNPNPGYVAGYVPGIRENGGQYTHAATWVVPAYARLGQADRAVEALALMNPILAAASPALADRYNTEPYVLAGDVYYNTQHRGRGGWSWYTGSAGWYYRVALESVLGLELRGDRLAVRPSIPATWPGFTMVLRHRSAIYRIHVENGGPARELWLDGGQVNGDVDPARGRWPGTRRHSNRVDADSPPIDRRGLLHQPLRQSLARRKWLTGMAAPVRNMAVSFLFDRLGRGYAGPLVWNDRFFGIRRWRQPRQRDSNGFRPQFLGGSGRSVSTNGRP